jgi:hypothetical protein
MSGPIGQHKKLWLISVATGLGKGTNIAKDRAGNLFVVTKNGTEAVPLNLNIKDMK